MMRSGARHVAVPSLIALVVTAVLGCSQKQAAETPRIEEKRVAITPAEVPVQVGVLTGALSDLRVVERVNVATGEVVYAPQLQGTLKLTNTSTDQAVSLVDGSLEFLDAEKHPIALPEGRRDTTLRLGSYSGGRLDPGAEMRREVDVPFPAAALKSGSLADVRLNVTYIPAPYQKASATVAAQLAGH